MTYKYNIPVELLGLNEYINKERGNRFRAGKLKKEYTDLCTVYAKKLKKLPANTQFDLTINWTTITNKKDPDNIFFGVKFILDGLVNSGKLENDTRKFIRNIHHNIKTGTKYNIEIILTPTDGN